MLKKKETRVRSTISIPAQLKREMAAFDGEVNWSAIACQAFRRKMNEIESETLAIEDCRVVSAELLSSLQPQSGLVAGWFMA